MNFRGHDAKIPCCHFYQRKNALAVSKSDLAPVCDSNPNDVSLELKAGRVPNTQIIRGSGQKHGRASGNPDTSRAGPFQGWPLDYSIVKNIIHIVQYTHIYVQYL